MSKEKPKSDIQSIITLRLFISFNIEKCVLPSRSILPPLSFTIPGLSSLSLLYYTVNGSFPTEPVDKKDLGKKDLNIENSSVDVQLVSSLQREIDVPNPIGLIQQLLGSSIKLTLGAVAGSEKEPKEKSPSSFLSLPSSLLLVDIPIQSSFNLTVQSGSSPDLCLTGSLYLSILRSSHTVESNQQKFLSFLPRFITESTQNILVLRILSFQGVPILKDTNYRAMFFEPAKVSLTIFGTTQYSEPIPQDCIDGACTQSSIINESNYKSSMKYTLSSETAIELCYAKIFTGKEELDTLLEELANRPAKIELFYRNPIKTTQEHDKNINSTKETKGPVKKQPTSAAKPVRDADASEDNYLIFSATAELNLSSLIEENRVISIDAQIKPSFEQRTTQVPNLFKVASHHLTCTSISGKAGPTPETLALGSWEKASFRVQAATAGLLRNFKANNYASTTSQTTATTAQHFERAYFYLKPTDSYVASMILLYVAQKNINAIRLLNPTLAGQFEQPEVRAGHKLKGSTNTNASSTLITDNTTVEEILASPTFNREDSQEWLSQCGSLLKSLNMEAVKEKLGTSKVSETTKAPFITGWHFSDPSFQLFCLEAPACYGLLQVIAHKVDSITKLQLDQAMDTLVAPCAKCGPNVQFSKRLMPTSPLLLERFCFISGIQQVAEKASSWTNITANPQNKRALSNILALFTNTIVEDEPIYDLLGKVIRRCFRTRYTPITMNMRQIAGIKAFLDENDINGLQMWMGSVLPAHLRTVSLLSYHDGPTIPTTSMSNQSLVQKWSLDSKSNSQRLRTHGLCENMSVDMSLTGSELEEIADYKATLAATAHEVSDLSRRGKASKDQKKRTLTMNQDMTTSSILCLTKRLKYELCDEDGVEENVETKPLSTEEKKIVDKILKKTLLSQRSKTVIEDAVTGKTKFIYSNQTLGVKNIQNKYRELFADENMHNGMILYDSYEDKSLPHLSNYSSKGSREYALEKGYLNVPNLRCKPFEASGQYWRFDAKQAVDQYKKDDLMLPWDEDTIRTMLLAQPTGECMKSLDGKPMFNTHIKQTEYFDQDKERMLSVLRDDDAYKKTLQKKLKQEWKDKIVVSHAHINLPKVNRTDAEGRLRSSLSHPILQDEPMKYSIKMVNKNGNINQVVSLANQEPWTSASGGSYDAMLRKAKPQRLKKASDVNPTLVEEITAIARSSRLVFKSREEADTMTEAEKKKRCAELRWNATVKLMLKMRSLRQEEVEGIDTNELVKMAKYIISKNGEGHYDLNLSQFNTYLGKSASELLERTPKKMANPSQDLLVAL